MQKRKNQRYRLTTYILRFIRPAVFAVSFISTLISGYTKAQESLHVLRLSKTFFLFDRDTAGNVVTCDSSFNNLPNYFERNLMGNIGFPEYPFLVAYRDENPIGLKWFTSPYDNRILGLRSDNYYTGKGIYTTLFGAAGSVKEQTLQLFHTQNVNDKVNFTLKLNRYGALGYYQYQQSFVNNVVFSSNYLNRKKRFGYATSISFDRFKHLENGGVKTDTSIVANPFIDKGLIPVYLSNAKRNYSMLAADLNFFVGLNKDSMATIRHYITTGLKYAGTKSVYTDNPMAGYYDFILKDSVATNDSVQFSKLSPFLCYNIVAGNLNIDLGGRLERSELNTSDTLHVYASTVINQSLAWKNKRIVVKEHAEYIAAGTNSGDYRAEAGGQFQLPWQSGLAVRAFYENRSPDLFFNYYYSNNYKWENNFGKTKTVSGELKLMVQKLKLDLGVVLSSSTGLIALAQNAMPARYNERVGVMHFYGTHHLKIKRVHLENSIHYQTTNSYVINLPPLYTRHQLYYEHLVKRNGLRFQVGIQAQYLAEMDKISYNPALNSFYLKYGTEKGGNYVFADFFFNVNFKPVKLFFKTEHLNQGFTGTNYTLLNNYYQRDRAFRFGLYWEFKD